MRRIGYALAAPAIPLIRLSHVMRGAIENRSAVRPLLAAAPVILAGLAVDCVAQATGVVCGAGGSMARLTAYEFHRSEVNRTGRAPS